MHQPRRHRQTALLISTHRPRLRASATVPDVFTPFLSFPHFASLFLYRDLFCPLERAEITLRCFSLSSSYASETLSPSSLVFAFYFSPSLDRSPRISRITRKTILRRVANSPTIGFLRDRTRQAGVGIKDRNLCLDVHEFRGTSFERV